MPVFEYHCPNCKNVLERYESPRLHISEIECSGCGTKMTKVEYYSNSLSFRGSGWYVTDYGKGNRRNKENE